MKRTVTLPVSLVGKFCISVDVPDSVSDESVSKAHSSELSAAWVDVVTRAVVGKMADGIWFDGTMKAGDKEFTIGMKPK